MLARIALDPQALSLSNCDDALKASVARSLFSIIRRQAVLCVGSAPGPSAAKLFEHVNTLPPALQADWQKLLVWALKHDLLRPVPKGWDGDLTTCNGDELEVFFSTVDVLAVRPELSEQFGAEPALIRGVEICRLDCIAGSDTLQRLSPLTQGAFATGERLSSVWDRCFQPLNRLFDRITIVDRYCIQNMLTSASGSSGLESFLRRLLTDTPRPKTVTIISAEPAKPDELVRERLRGFLSDWSVEMLKRADVHLVPDGVFKEKAHFRYIRFNTSHYLILDKGMDLFGSDPLECAHPYSLRPVDDAISAPEGSLRGSGRLINLVDETRRGSERSAAAPSTGRLSLSLATERPVPGRPVGSQTRR